MWQFLLPALALGFISSFHCVGMCGPIALALPVHNLGSVQKTLAVTLYHTGKIFTYCLLGLVFGLAGRQLYLAGFQRWLSVSTGVVILFIIIHQQLYKKNGGSRLFNKLFYSVQGFIQYAWGQRTVLKFLVIGMLNGLLPCGMVYFALAGTLGSTNPIQSVFFMAVFGLGTLPLMAAVHFFGLRYLSLSVRNKMRQAIPFFLCTMGVLLILRGMNLGIPYLSPYIGKDPSQTIICH
jgi:sulfite exporter TauE/SafE